MWERLRHWERDWEDWPWPLRLLSLPFVVVVASVSGTVFIFLFFGPLMLAVMFGWWIGGLLFGQGGLMAAAVFLLGVGLYGFLLGEGGKP